MTNETDDWLERISTAIDSNELILPSVPQAAFEVRKVLLEPECDITDLEQVIAHDPALAARLIKVANSSARLRNQHIASLRQAISRLGSNLVGSFVTHMAMLQVMSRHRDHKRLQGFLQSSLAISARCYSLALANRYIDPEHASLAGLLHDIGKLPLREFFQRRTSLSVEQAQALEIELHPAAGAMMLERWNLDASLINAARDHERVFRNQPDQGPDYTDVVIAANVLHYGVEHGRYAHLSGARIPAMEKCLSPEDLEKVNHSFEERMEVASRMIG